MSNSSFLRTLLLILVIVLAAGLIWFGINSVNNSINTAMDPLQKANDALSTQMSDLLHPTPTIIPDPVTIINEVRAVARLETIQFTVEKVITAESNQGVLAPLFGDRLLFVGHGVVIAGIDMQKIDPEDMRLEDGVLYVHLPEPEILVATLDNDKSYVYNRQTGVLTKGQQDLETQARQVAEQEIRRAALEDGILDLARQNAETYLEKWCLNESCWAFCRLALLARPIRTGIFFLHQFSSAVFFFGSKLARAQIKLEHSTEGRHARLGSLVPGDSLAEGGFDCRRPRDQPPGSACTGILVLESQDLQYAGQITAQG